MNHTIKIGQKLIGDGQPVFIIAEAGVNHNGDPELAKKLIDVACEAGADAVKFQTFTPELLVTSTADQAQYQAANSGKKESQLAMLQRLALQPADWAALAAYARKKNILFLSTPFSEPDADLLETLDMAAYKIPSGEITNIPFLQHVAAKKKPMIVSTGMADLSEVEQAVAAIQPEGAEEVILLHSTSNYPPSPESMNLRAITTLADTFHLPVGYSDNGSAGYVAEVAAVALGACVIEKHFTLDKNLPGPDHVASMDPKELAAMVAAIRMTERMLGTGEKKPALEEEPIKAMARKSIVAKGDIAAGTVLSVDDFIMKRPGTGLAPSRVNELVGKRATRNIIADTLITPDDYAD